MADTADTVPSTAPSSAQVIVHWKKDRNGHKATCKLKGRKNYSFVISSDATASSIDANVLGHYGLRANTGCCVHDGNMPPSLRGMR
jgi:hypothetical protein